VWLAPVIVIGGDSYLDELLTIAGGRNVYRDQRVLSPQVSMEDVVRRDPDVVLTSGEGRPKILADPAWRGLRAVRSGRVLAVDTLLVGRPGPRMGQAAATIARLLHGPRRGG
jgi:iron complex transport system substrate-binding protein